MSCRPVATAIESFEETFGNDIKYAKDLVTQSGYEYTIDDDSITLNADGCVIKENYYAGKDVCAREMLINTEDESMHVYIMKAVNCGNYIRAVNAYYAASSAFNDVDKYRIAALEKAVREF